MVTFYFHYSIYTCEWKFCSKEKLSAFPIYLFIQLFTDISMDLWIYVLF